MTPTPNKPEPLTDAQVENRRALHEARKARQECSCAWTDPEPCSIAELLATLDAARTPSQPEHHPDGACWAAVAYCTNDAGHPGSCFNPRVSPDPAMPPPEYPAWIVEDPSDG